MVKWGTPILEMICKIPYMDILDVIGKIFDISLPLPFTKTILLVK